MGKKTERIAELEETLASSRMLILSIAQDLNIAALLPHDWRQHPFQVARLFTRAIGIRPAPGPVAPTSSADAETEADPVSRSAPAETGTTRPRSAFPETPELPSFDAMVDDQVAKIERAKAPVGANAVVISDPGAEVPLEMMHTLRNVIDAVAQELGIEHEGQAPFDVLYACYNEIRRIKNPDGTIDADTGDEALSKGDSLAEAVAHGQRTENTLREQLEASRTLVNRIAGALQISTWSPDGAELLERVQAWSTARTILRRWHRSITIEVSADSNVRVPARHVRISLAELIDRMDGPGSADRDFRTMKTETTTATSATSSAPAETAAQTATTSTDKACQVCARLEAHPDHRDRGMTNYHQFVSSSAPAETVAAPETTTAAASPSVLTACRVCGMPEGFFDHHGLGPIAHPFVPGGQFAPVTTTRSAPAETVDTPSAAPGMPVGLLLDEEKIQLLQWLSDHSTMIGGASGPRVVLDDVIRAAKIALASAKHPDDPEERMKRIRERMSRLKHGPKGTGQPGSCEPDCLKCELDRELKALQLGRAAPIQCIRFTVSLIREAELPGQWVSIFHELNLKSGGVTPQRALLAGAAAVRMLVDHRMTQDKMLAHEVFAALKAQGGFRGLSDRMILADDKEQG